MATHYSANQFQSTFNSSNLQNWTIPKPYKERPSTHDGHTQFITNDRGHLLPGVPRSKVNPWGTFMGTWDMPLKIPPSKLSLTSRSANQSKRLTDWIQRSSPLISACNGLRPHITGQPSGIVDETQSSRCACHQQPQRPSQPRERNSPESGTIHQAERGDLESPKSVLKE